MDTKTPDRLSQIDTLRLDAAHSKLRAANLQVELVRREAETAQNAVKDLEQELVARYRLSSVDRIDLATGMINRPNGGPQPEAPEVVAAPQG